MKKDGTKNSGIGCQKGEKSESPQYTNSDWIIILLFIYLEAFKVQTIGGINL